MPPVFRHLVPTDGQLLSGQLSTVLEPKGQSSHHLCIHSSEAHSIVVDGHPPGFLLGGLVLSDDHNGPVEGLLIGSNEVLEILLPLLLVGERLPDFHVTTPLLVHLSYVLSIE